MAAEPDRLALDPEPQVVTHTTCRICGGRLLPILSLGPLALADFPRSAGTMAHPRVPLDLLRCAAPACGLVQLAQTTPFQWLYGSIYWYRSGVNETMVAELQDIVREGLRRVYVAPGMSVVDIGANDGTLLQQYKVLLPDTPLLTVAYEPARNLYEALRPHASVLQPDAFRVDEDWPVNMLAQVVTSIAMFYDLDDPLAFVLGITRILAPHGVWIVQQAYLLDMLAKTAFDNIGHEHLEYYDLHALEYLLEPFGLVVVDVERRSINGGSFRTYIQWVGHQVHPRVAAMRAVEAPYHADPAPVWARFTRQAEAVRRQLRAVLEAYAAIEAPVDLYAASTKSHTLLQWAGIDARLVRQAWERSPEKVGRYVGTSGIPIVGEAEGRADPPAALLVGAWQFRDAFLRREGEYLRAGGRMIFPLPQVEIVEEGRGR